MANDKRQTNGIRIDDNYGIVVMPVDYALAKIKTDKAGNSYFVPFAFYGSVQKCLKAYLRESVHDELTVDSVITLNDALERIATACTRVARAICNVCPQYEIVEEQRR